MPILNWLGKDKVVNHHLAAPFHFLRRKFAVGNSANMIIHGDNLLALKSLLPRFAGKIKCIYIDPPYNTGNEGWIYNDNVNDPTIQRWLGSVVGKEGEDLSRHDKWLCMMYPRLRLLQKLLADDGAIFISIDDNEQANLKLICDEIFGANNFIAQFAWKRKKEISNDSRNVSTQGEYIICYGKSLQTELNRETLSDESIRKSYHPPTEQFPLDYWRTVPITVSKGLSGGGYEYAIETPSGAIHRKLWAYPRHSYDELVKSGKVYFGKNGSASPMRVMYLSESSGKPTSNYWDNIASNREGKNEILNIFGGNVFQTPKPTALIEKILKLATDKDSIVLDSFAGSGTTAHAVINLNKSDGGSRRFILIELMDYAETITAERVRRIGGEFDYYEVGAALFDEYGNLNAEAPVENLRDYVWYSETQKDLPPATDEKYLLGVDEGTAYYFCHEPEEEYVLNFDLLSTIKTRARRYVIYAAACHLSEGELARYRISYRRIPDDVRKY